MQLENLRSGLDGKIAEIEERTKELETLQASVASLTEARQNLETEVSRVKTTTDSLIADNEKAISKAQEEACILTSILSHWNS